MAPSLEQLLALQGLSGGGGGGLDTTALLSGLGNGNAQSNAGLGLDSFSKTIAANDPFSIASGAVDAWKPNTSTWSPTESGVASFAKAFIGGALGGIGRNNQADQLNSVIGILPQLYKDPASVATPDGVDQGAFDTLKGASILRKYQTDSVNEEKQKEGVRSLLEKLDISPKEKLAIATSNDPASLVAGLTDGPSDHLTKYMDALEIPPEMRGGITSVTEADHIHDKVILQHAKDDAKQAQADAKGEIQKNKNNLVEEARLRRELNQNNDLFRRAKALAPLLDDAQKFMAQDSPQGDIGLADVANKAINPGGTLQEGLMQMTMDGRSPFNKFAGDIRNALEGKGRFTLAVKQDFYNTIHTYVTQGLAAAKKDVDDKLKIAGDSGLTPSNILSDDRYDSLFSLLNNQTTSNTSIVPIREQVQAAHDILAKQYPKATPAQLADALRKQFGG